jgi:hypothetical protein
MPAYAPNLPAVLLYVDRPEVIQLPGGGGGTMSGGRLARTSARYGHHTGVSDGSAIGSVMLRSSAALSAPTGSVDAAMVAPSVGTLFVDNHAHVAAALYRRQPVPAGHHIHTVIPALFARIEGSVPVPNGVGAHSAFDVPLFQSS